MIKRKHIPSAWIVIQMLTFSTKVPSKQKDHHLSFNPHEMQIYPCQSLGISYAKRKEAEGKKKSVFPTVVYNTLYNIIQSPMVMA
jgi:hypothetical protein